MNVADRFPAERVVALSALAGAAFNAAITLTDGNLASVFVLRFLTGAALAGVYPPGMKIMASWFDRGRGLALGILVGALTAGSAGPHLLNAVPLLGGEPGIPPWRTVLLVASAMGAAGGLITLGLIRSGPGLPGASPFDWRYVGRIFTDRGQRLAPFGYLGHMWERYEMGTWVPLCLTAVYAAAGWSETGARLAGFATIAAGAPGCIVAGRLADRLGRTTIAGASLIVSGACCLLAGVFLGSPAALTVLCVIWGFAVVADSAQFSTAVSELADPRYVGTALTMQTCSGFLLTLISIRLVPLIVEHGGWGWAFAMLAPGPVFGIVSMARLRVLPEATKMASGRK